VLKDNKHTKKVIQKYENNEKKAAIFDSIRRFDSTEKDDLEILTNAKRQTRVELENFSNTGKILQEKEMRKIASNGPQLNEQDEVIPGVYIR